jgi:transcriptional regulator
MYMPKHFASEDLAIANEVIDQNAFAIFLTRGDDMGISHIPIIRMDDGSQFGKLIGHVAKPNPQGSHFDGNLAATAIFSGPHAYVSPSWYTTPEMVPTWNYAAIHAHGKPSTVEDMSAVRAIMDELVSRFESDETGNWSTAQLSEKRMIGQMKGVVTFEMPIERLEIKLKMSQNRSAADADGVITALSASTRETDRATAQMMGRIDRSAS